MPADGLMAGRTNEVLERVYIFQYKVEKWMATFFLYILLLHTVCLHYHSSETALTFTVHEKENRM